MGVSTKKRRMLDLDATVPGSLDSQIADEEPANPGVRPKKSKRLPWEQEKGWNPIEAGDSLLIGSSEGGFIGLEEFSPAEAVLVDGSAAELLNKSGTAVAEPQSKSFANRSAQYVAPLHAGTAKDTSRNMKKGAKLSKEQPEGAALEALTRLEKLEAKLAALEAENLQLRATAGSGSTMQDAKNTSKAPEQEASPLNHKQRKKIKRAAHLAAKREELRKQRRDDKVASKRKAAAESTKDAEGAAGHSSGLLVEGAARGVDVSAWMPFDLDPQIQNSLSRMGFSSPTPIQQECLPAAIRDRRDVIGAAQTGSGKTLAFGLPIIQALLEERKSSGSLASADGGIAEGTVTEEQHLRALVLAPTRELAMQVSNHIQAVAKPCGIWVVPIVGGIAAAKQERLLKNKPEIVVATPGRLWELMRDGDKHLTNMRALSFLVLDEADRMVQQGHFEELSSILDFVPRRVPENAKQGTGTAAPTDAATTTLHSKDLDEDLEAERDRGGRRKLQTFVFSATLTLPESLRKRLRKGGGGASGSITLEGLMEKIPFTKKPKIADLTSSHRLADKVTEACLECTEDDKDERLYYLLTQHPGRTLVFANAISTVRRLAAILKLLQLPVTPLHASMQQRQRLKALDRFRESEDAILVATDVAARGLDIPEVKCVVHYQIPAAADVYVHRCGRTARAAAEGISVALITPKESSRYSALLKALERDAPPTFPMDQSLLPGAHKRMRLAVRLDEALRSSSKEAAEKSWERQAAEAAGIELSNDEEGHDRKQERKHHRVDAAAIQQELVGLLQQPLQPRYSQRYFAGAPSASISGEAAAAAQSGEENGAGHEHQTGLVAVSQAVEHAKRLADSRRAAKTAGDKSSKQITGRKKEEQNRKGNRKQQGKQPVTREAALAAALAKKRANKKGAGKSRFVVIPGVVGRVSHGPDALEALRRKIAATNA